jgi:hypothetical protein
MHPRQPEESGEVMPQFKIEATRTISMFAIVEANSAEEAEKLYDNELIAEDYEEDPDGYGSWKLDSIIELEAI